MKNDILINIYVYVQLTLFSGMILEVYTVVSYIQYKTQKVHTKYDEIKKLLQKL